MTILTVSLEDCLRSLDEIENACLEVVSHEYKHLTLEQLVLKITSKFSIELHDKLKVLEIIKYALTEITNNLESFNLLKPRGPSIMHLRKILECTTHILFLLSNEESWEKYSIKWKLYPVVMSINRWASQDRSTWHPRTIELYENLTSFYKENYHDFKLFLKKDKAKKLSGNLENDIKLFFSVNSWTSPRSFTDIFQSAEIKIDTQDLFYKWWSDSIHFSPMNQTMHNANTIYGDYSEVGEMSIVLELSNLFKNLAIYTPKFDFFYNVSQLLSHQCIKEFSLRNPISFQKKIEAGDEYSRLIIGLTLRKITAQTFLEITSANYNSFKERNKRFGN